MTDDIVLSQKEALFEQFGGGGGLLKETNSRSGGGRKNTQNLVKEKVRVHFSSQKFLDVNDPVKLTVTLVCIFITNTVSGAHLGFSEGRSPNFKIGVNQYKTKKKRI